MRTVCHRIERAQAAKLAQLAGVHQHQIDMTWLNTLAPHLASINVGKTFDNADISASKRLAVRRRTRQYPLQADLKFSDRKKRDFLEIKILRVYSSMA